MKRIYTVLLLICFAVVSCTEDVLKEDYGKDYIVLDIYNSPMTKATEALNTDYERKLNRLDCFFYVKDQTDQACVYYHKVDVNDYRQVTLPIYVKDSVMDEIFSAGMLCDVFVIANYPGSQEFSPGADGTDVESLKSYVLDMKQNKYDAVGEPFVMTGSGTVQRGRNSATTATISLKRVAAKVTMTVKVPKSILVDKGTDKITMLPVLTDDQGNKQLKSSFRYGTAKSYLGGIYPDAAENYIKTDKIPYTLSETLSTDEYYLLTCDIPFYTYAREWEKGADNAAYMTLELPWGEDLNNDGAIENNYKTYYYQILVNGMSRNFVPNSWYDMSVTVGVLGNTVESTPVELEKLSYYVLEWTEETSNGTYGSGDREENVQIEKYNFLEIPQSYIEMDNIEEVAIRYNASHKIGIKFNATTTGRSVSGLDETTNLSAFYIDNSSGKPVAKTLEDKIYFKNVADNNGNVTTNSNFTDNDKGLLTFKYELSDQIYSPVYIFLTVWLDIDGDGVHGDDEVLTQDVNIVMYPSIYIIGDNSTEFSVFVNGAWNNVKKVNSSTGEADYNSDPYIVINGQRAGKVTGWDTSTYMHVITVSAFSEENYMFAYNEKNILDTPYIIGDPRVREPYKFGVPDGGNGWAEAKDAKGVERSLENYYPTSTEANAYQVIAPKFRISSKLAGYSHSSPQGAAYRCASYQEDGYPAGRWRLPTTAEVMFVINLQNKKKIQTLFHGTNAYYSATDNVVNNTNGVTLSFGHEGFTDGNSTAPNAKYGSVRCVYDEWYWGSAKEAVENTSYNGGYEFTWGDRKIY